MILSIKFFWLTKKSCETVFICRWCAGAAGLTKTGVTRAAPLVTRVNVVKLIPKANLIRTAKEFLSVSSLCALSNDTVLLACPLLGLRALSLHTGHLSARDPAVVMDVRKVAYEKHTDTLLLVVKIAADNWQLVSLRRKNADEWLEVQRLSIDNNITSNHHLAICGSRVMLGGKNNLKSTMYVFVVSAEHNVRAAGTVAVEDTEPFFKFACTRLGNDTLFALTHLKHLSLMRLESQSLKHLATANFNNPSDVLFFGDLLLVADADPLEWKNNIIQLLQVSGGRLTEQRRLRDLRADSKMGAWTLANDRLIYWDMSSNAAKALIVYTFAWAISESNVQESNAN